MLTKKLLIPAAFAMAATFTTGCQQTTMADTAMEGDVDPMAELRSVAEEALRTANTAAHDAATAKDMALAAQEAANAAQACCDANSRRMGRMFDGSMGSK
ncbi:MAG: alanine-zipper protein [Gammaproteobacteria bacterium]